tara:strand:- start:3814 stop:4959 length:1146 start_codon:yes stop_codon:yes gene_type:complete
MENNPESKPYNPQRKSSLITFILLGAVVYMATIQVKAWWSDQAAASITPRTVTPRDDLGEGEKATIKLFEETSPSVVFITTINLRRDFFSTNIYKIPAGTGSGFIWDSAGHIVTNYHVIKGADEAKITLWDQSTWDAKLVGAEPDKDLAVLKIKAPDKRLKPIKIGESKNLLVGQNAYAIGNPFGFDQTLTTGIISALGREIESITRRPITGVIQTNAAINPGNSGGPLLDSANRLIGINTAIYSPTGSYAGIGFAVPVDTVNRIVPQLIEFGKVIKPGLGINIAPDSFVTNRLNTTGVLILNTVPGGGAQKAGLKATTQSANGRISMGDIIKEIEGKTVIDSSDLFRILDSKVVGDKVKVTVERGGESKKTEVTLGALKE